MDLRRLVDFAPLLLASRHTCFCHADVLPFLEGRETETRFVPARVTDNRFCNAEYVKVLQNLSGWQKRAWFDGDRDIAAGQFLTMLRRKVHVVEDFDDRRAAEWWAALDDGFTHYTVCLLGCREWRRQRVRGGRTFRAPVAAAEACASDSRHARTPSRAGGGRSLRVEGQQTRSSETADLKRFVAGADVFSQQSDGTTIAGQYARQGITLCCANTDRVNGWAEVLQRLGDVEAGIVPTLFFHRRCARLVECLPSLQHDPNHLEDVLKVDADEDRVGGDDAADTLRYLVATKAREVRARKLRGL